MKFYRYPKELNNYLVEKHIKEIYKKEFPVAYCYRKGIFTKEEIHIFSSKCGYVMGYKGKEINKFKEELKKSFGRNVKVILHESRIIK